MPASGACASKYAGSPSTVQPNRVGLPGQADADAARHLHRDVGVAAQRLESRQHAAVDAVPTQRLPHQRALDAVVGGGEIHEAAVALPLAGLLLAARAMNAPVDDVLQREEVVVDGQQHTADHRRADGDGPVAGSVTGIALLQQRRDEGGGPRLWDAAGVEGGVQQLCQRASEQVQRRGAVVGCLLTWRLSVSQELRSSRTCRWLICVRERRVDDEEKSGN